MDEQVSLPSNVGTGWYVVRSMARRVDGSVRLNLDPLDPSPFPEGLDPLGEVLDIAGADHEELRAWRLAAQRAGFADPAEWVRRSLNDAAEESMPTPWPVPFLRRILRALTG